MSGSNNKQYSEFKPDGSIVTFGGATPTGPLTKKAVRHRSVEKSHRFNEGGERKRYLNARTNTAREQFFSAGGNSGRHSQVTFNKYPAKAEGDFADLPAVRDSQAATDSRMREYR